MRWKGGNVGGTVRALRAGELAERAKMDPNGAALRRGWEYWAKKAGCGDML